MSTTILPIRGPVVPTIAPLPSIAPAGSKAATSFTDLLSSSVNTVETAGKDATQAAQQFLSGSNEDLHTVAIAEQKAELTTELFLQIRSKAISAYQEVMRMQL